MTTYSTNRRSTSVPSSSEVGLAYYGFARGASHQSRVEDHGAEPDTAALPLRHQVNQGWKAIHSLAASYTSNNSTADFIEATAPLGKKRSSPPNESDTSDPDLQVIKHRTKRARLSESSPTGAASAAFRPNSIRDSVGPKKKVVKMSWTEEEVDILFKGRQDGKDWDKIHAVSSTPALISFRKIHTHDMWTANIDVLFCLRCCRAILDALVRRSTATSPSRGRSERCPSWSRMRHSL